MERRLSPPLPVARQKPSCPRFQVRLQGPAASMRHCETPRHLARVPTCRQYVRVPLIHTSPLMRRVVFALATWPRTSRGGVSHREGPQELGL